jgi:hypothetical protein
MGTLPGETTFYWKIVADDGTGTTESPIFSFTTGVSDNKPTIPSQEVLMQILKDYWIVFAIVIGVVLLLLLR